MPDRSTPPTFDTTRKRRVPDRELRLGDSFTRGGGPVYQLHEVLGAGEGWRLRTEGGALHEPWYGASRRAWRYRTFGTRPNLEFGGYRYVAAFGSPRSDGTWRVFYGPAAERHAARDRTGSSP